MFGLFKSQQVYTVHERPDPPADRDDRAEQLKFVREGFALFAFLLPPVWMLANRLWLVLIGYLVLLAVVHGLITVFEVPEHWRYYATMAVNFLCGFEADALERWTLDRRGWRIIGLVSGANFDECERRFFEGWVPTVAVVTPANLDAPGSFQATTAPERPRRGEIIPPKRTGWRSPSVWSGLRRT